MEEYGIEAVLARAFCCFASVSKVALLDPIDDCSS